MALYNDTGDQFIKRIEQSQVYMHPILEQILYKANINRSEGRNSCNAAIVLDFNSSLSTMDVIQMENQYGNTGLEPHFGPTKWT
jgi:hypothetical protein